MLCEQNLRAEWSRIETVRAEIGQILHTHTHADKLVIEIVFRKKTKDNGTQSYPASPRFQWYTNTIIIVEFVCKHLLKFGHTRGGSCQHGFMCGCKQWSNDINESN